MTSKNNNNSTPSQNNTRSSSSSSHPTQPQQYFTGYSEFFYLFLRSVDSHSLNTILIRTLWNDILKKIVKQEEDDDDDAVAMMLSQRLPTLKLLAKFLGFLLFSPHWDISSPTPSGLTTTATTSTTGGGASGGFSYDDDAIHCLNNTQIIIPIKSTIERAWIERRLIGVIPWICDFLGMMRWDKLSIRCDYWRRVFGLLRSIQRSIGGGEDVRSGVYMLVGWELEGLFADVIPLEVTECLPLVRLPIRDDDDDDDDDYDDIDENGSRRLDCRSLLFSETFLYATFPHLEDFDKLIDNAIIVMNKDTPQQQQQQQQHPMTPMTTTNKNTPHNHRKMNSYLLTTPDHSITPTTTTTRPTPNTPDDAWIHINDFNSPDGINSNAFSSPSPHPTTSDLANIRAKLTDAFFHQHRHLRTIAEFVVTTTLKNIINLVTTRCIAPLITNYQPTSSSPDLHPPADLQSQCLTSARSFMTQQCRHFIPSSMTSLLSGMDVDETVKSTCIKLAVRYGERRGCDMILERVVSSVKGSDVMVLWEKKMREEEKKRREGEMMTKKKEEEMRRMNVTNDKMVNDVDCDYRNILRRFTMVYRDITSIAATTTTMTDGNDQTLPLVVENKTRLLRIENLVEVLSSLSASSPSDDELNYECNDDTNINKQNDDDDDDDTLVLLLRQFEDAFCHAWDIYFGTTTTTTTTTESNNTTTTAVATQSYIIQNHDRFILPWISDGLLVAVTWGRRQVEKRQLSSLTMRHRRHCHRRHYHRHSLRLLGEVICHPQRLSSFIESYNGREVLSYYHKRRRLRQSEVMNGNNDNDDKLSLSPLSLKSSTIVNDDVLWNDTAHLLCDIIKAGLVDIPQLEQCLLDVWKGKSGDDDGVDDTSWIVKLSMTFLSHWDKEMRNDNDNHGRSTAMRSRRMNTMMRLKQKVEKKKKSHLS